MLLQEELARGLVTMTSQTLFAIVSMGHSVLRWMSSSTHAVSASENFMASVSAALLGGGGSGMNTNMSMEHHSHARSALNPNDATTPGAASEEHYVYSVIHTVILLLVVWAYFKTVSAYFNIVSVVWRSFLAFWESARRVWRIVGIAGSKMARLANRLGWMGRCEQRGSEVAPVGNYITLDALDPSIRGPTPPLLQMNTNTATTTALTTPQEYSQHTMEQAQQLFLQSQLGPMFSPPPLLPPQGVIWYYYDPVTQNMVPWLSPHPPPLPMTMPMPMPMPMLAPPFPMGAPLVPQFPSQLPAPAGLPQESFFVPISEAPGGDERQHEGEGEPGFGQHTNANNNSLMGLGEYPSGNPCGEIDRNYNDETTHAAAMLVTPGKTANANAHASQREVAADPTGATIAVANTTSAAATAAANVLAHMVDNMAASECATPKKRKATALEKPPVESNGDPATATATESRHGWEMAEASQVFRDIDRRPSKKEKRQQAKANARAWAEHTFGSAN